MTLLPRQQRIAPYSLRSRAAEATSSSHLSNNDKAYGCRHSRERPARLENRTTALSEPVRFLPLALESLSPRLVADATARTLVDRRVGNRAVGSQPAFEKHARVSGPGGFGSARRPWCTYRTRF